MINWMKRRIERSRARCHRAARGLRRPHDARAHDDVSLKDETDSVGLGAEAKGRKTLRRRFDAFARA